MNATDVLEISREAIWVMLKIAAPLIQNIRAQMAEQEQKKDT